MAKEKVKEEKEERKGSGLKVVFLSVLLSTAILVCYHFFILQKEMINIKIFDLTKYLSILQKAYISGQISQQELAEVLKSIKTKLDEESRGNVIILPANIVLNKVKNREIRLNNSKFSAIKEKLNQISKKKNK